MAKVFICYRRQDSQVIVDHLRYRLVNQYGDSNVVLDIDSVPIGVNFREYLDKHLKLCDVVLVVIGKDWLGASNAHGIRRLNDPRDFVRIEVELALRNQLPIVPVLVGGAAMPLQEELPESLATLADVNAAEIASGKDFENHFDRLVGGINALVKSAKPDVIRTAPRLKAERTARSPKAISVLEPKPPREPDRPPKASRQETPTPPSHGEQLMEVLKGALRKFQPDARWDFHKGWWFLRGKAGYKLVRVKPSTNLIYVRIRKNLDRSRSKQPLVWDNWIAEDAESTVRNEEQLGQALKRIAKQWG